MTSERAIARLAKNCLDEVALAEVYKNNRKEIDQVIAEWFGTGTIVQDVLSRVLVRLSRSAPQFQSEVQTAESFIVECAGIECKAAYDEMGRRIALSHSN